MWGNKGIKADFQGIKYMDALLMQTNTVSRGEINIFQIDF